MLCNIDINHSMPFSAQMHETYWYSSLISFSEQHENILFFNPTTNENIKITKLTTITLALHLTIAFAHTSPPNYAINYLLHVGSVNKQLFNWTGSCTKNAKQLLGYFMNIQSQLNWWWGKHYFRVNFLPSVIQPSPKTEFHAPEKYTVYKQRMW